MELQLPNGRWYERESILVMAYLELDALYALSYMSELVPDYRTDDIWTDIFSDVRFYQTRKVEATG